MTTTPAQRAILVFSASISASVLLMLGSQRLFRTGTELVFGVQARTLGFAFIALSALLVGTAGYFFVRALKQKQ